MKKLWKLLALFLAVTVIFCGCASGNTQAEPTEQEKVTKPTEWQDRFEEKLSEVQVEILKAHFAVFREELEAIASAKLELQPNADELVAAYLESSPIQCDEIFVSYDWCMIQSKMCVFNYESYLDYDRVLYHADLIYTAEPGITGTDPYVFVPLDDHWQIALTFYSY